MYIELPCRCLESLLADGQCGHTETSFRLSTLNEGQQPKHQLVITIVLINGCFHNGPVKCPRLVIMTQGRLYWPEATPRAIMT